MSLMEIERHLYSGDEHVLEELDREEVCYPITVGNILHN